MKRIAISGSSGFVGSHFKAKHLELGHQVTCIDIKDGCDCRDWFRTNNEQYDICIHCAANIGGRASINGNPMWILENLSMDQACLDWVVRTQPAKVVIFSSSAAYPIRLQGISDSKLLAESDIDLDIFDEPDAEYGYCKWNLERLARIARKHTPSQIYVFRPMSGYGSTQSLDYPFPSFIKRALSDERPFIMFGDPSSTRDWIHINDIVDGVLAVTNSKHNHKTPLNLCTGVSTEFADLAFLCCEIAGKPLPNTSYEYENTGLVGGLTVCDSSSIVVKNGASGVYARVGDPTNLRKLYFPKIRFEDGIEMAVKFWKDK